MASSFPAGSTDHRPHIVLFPFMSKGHTIPLLHLARVLVNHGTVVTIFTTKANHPFIAQFLNPDTSISIIDLPFPNQIDGLPQGIESTDKLPSMSLFRQFAIATELMQPHFEQSIKNLTNVTCIVSDMFLYWTFESANKFGIPRVSFFGMSGYATAVHQEVGRTRLLAGPEGPESDDELIALNRFPWIKVTRNDFGFPFNQREIRPDDLYVEFVMKTVVATTSSYGQIMNSFYELEPVFIDSINSESKPIAWCVGPLCSSEASVTGTDRTVTDRTKPKWIEWLDEKLGEGRSVLYVAFGSQAEISTEQMEAISKGLEESEVNFLWVVRKLETEKNKIVDELEQRVGTTKTKSKRGMIVKEWVDQMEILRHESVNGFVSHCGWNSVLESVCSEVPILAWPMMAEQPLNARMVVEEIKVGLRVETRDGSVRGFVESGGLKKMVKELMEGEKGKEVRKKVKEVAAAAKAAVAEGGSSWRTLNELVNELEGLRKDSGRRVF